MKNLIFALAVGFIVFSGSEAFAQKTKYRKVQDVDFDGSNVDGKVRNPNGAYVTQRRGVDFVPLYNVKDQFDTSIKESIEHLED